MRHGRNGTVRSGLNVPAAVLLGIVVLGASASCYIGPGTAGPASGCTCDVTYGCDGCACEPAGECIQGGSCICDQTYGCDGCACEPVGECM